MNIKEKIKSLIEKAVNSLYYDFQSFENHGTGVLIERPKEAHHGDYSTNVALLLSKKLGKNPLEVTKKIVSYMKQQKFLEKIEVAPPGFINFYLSKDFFIENVKKILKSKNFGKNQNLKNQKIIIEHTQPNPFKEFHIGHLMNNAIGESLVRIIKINGAKVKVASYHGDIGLHVAKAIYGKKHMQPPPVSNEIKNWGFFYGFGSEMYENPEAKKEIDEINRAIYNKDDESINKIVQEGRKIFLDYFELLYKKLDSHFDRHFYESEVDDVGKNLVLKGVGKVFEKGDKGAIIFKGESFVPKTHTRVFVNAEGFPTYEAKELGLAKVKKDWYPFDLSITVTANEQDSFFNVTEVAIKEVFPKLKGKLKHLSHGILKLSTGKMSSRTGKVVTAEFLINEVKQKIKEKIGERNLDEKDLEKIAIGAIRYSILKQSIGSDIVYDFEKSISFEGDSGPYLQYAYARAQSVLRKAKVEKVKTSLKNVPSQISQLEKRMAHFPEVVEKAGKEYQPHFIVLYLTELAREFNNYYAHNKIVDKADEFSPYKVALAQAFSVVMKNGLWLLGIQAPEKM